MKGYDVRTIDDDKIGHVVDTDGDFLIVEHGLMKSKHALPMVFAEVDADEQVVRTALSKDLIHHSPKVNGDIDRTAIAEHYGLAEGFEDPTARGLGDELEPDDPAWAADQPLHDRIEMRKEVTSGNGPFDEPRFVTRRDGRRSQARLPERLNRPEAGAVHLLEERIQRGALLVVAEHHVPHEVRVRELEPLVTFERLAEPHDAALAADARDLQRLGRHATEVNERRTMSAVASAGSSKASCVSASHDVSFRGSTPMRSTSSP